MAIKVIMMMAITCGKDQNKGQVKKNYDFYFQNKHILKDELLNGARFKV